MSFDNGSLSEWKVSIVLVLYDPEELTVNHNALEELFNSLCLIKNKYELVIVINQPIEISHNIIKLINKFHFHSNVQVVQAAENLGPAGGFNLGYSKCNHSDLYVYLSTDAIIVDGNILNDMIHLFKNNSHIGITHPLSQFEDDDTFNAGTHANLQAYNNILTEVEESHLSNEERYNFAKNKESHIINSLVLESRGSQGDTSTPLIQAPLTFLGIRREVVELTKGFDSNMICGENIDLCLRALEYGYKTVRLNTAIIGHRRISFRVIGQGHGSLTKSRDVLAVEMIDYLNEKHGDYKDKYYKLRFKYTWPIVFILRTVKAFLR